MKSWLLKRRRNLQQELRTEQTDLLLKEHNENFPRDQLTKPNKEIHDKIETRVRDLTSSRMDSIMKNAFEVLKYLRICETKSQKIEYDATNINA